METGLVNDKASLPFPHKASHDQDLLIPARASIPYTLPPPSVNTNINPIHSSAIYSPHPDDYTFRRDSPNVGVSPLQHKARPSYKIGPYFTDDGLRNSDTVRMVAINSIAHSCSPDPRMEQLLWAKLYVIQLHFLCL